MNIVLRGALNGGAKDVRLVAAMGTTFVWACVPGAAYVLKNQAPLSALGPPPEKTAGPPLSAKMFFWRWRRGAWRERYESPQGRSTGRATSSGGHGIARDDVSACGLRDREKLRRRQNAACSQGLGSVNLAVFPGGASSEAARTRKDEAQRLQYPRPAGPRLSCYARRASISTSSGSDRQLGRIEVGRQRHVPKMTAIRAASATHCLAAKSSAVINARTGREDPRSASHNSSNA